jgi:cytoskeletal protein CcmA (bactofilin family)
MFIKGPLANRGATSRGEQLKFEQTALLQKSCFFTPVPEGDAGTSADAKVPRNAEIEEAQFTKTSAAQPVETEPSQFSEIETSQPAEAIGDRIVVVGKGTNIVGEISNCSQVEIEGALEGNVIAEVVIIRASGRLKGRVNSDRVEVHGSIEGEVQVKEHLDIRSTGQVSGDLSYGKLTVASGGYLAGNIHLCSDLQKQESKAEPLDADPFANKFKVQAIN